MQGRAVMRAMPGNSAVCVARRLCVAKLCLDRTGQDFYHNLYSGKIMVMEAPEVRSVLAPNTAPVGTAEGWRCCAVVRAIGRLEQQHPAMRKLRFQSPPSYLINCLTG